jgi:DNA mismatch endonuclease (patch repair protein)
MTAAQRSQLMSKIRKTDTKPELAVRRFVSAMGHRYRLHSNAVLGRPDLVFGPARKIIFVHGCFWHQHKGCRLAKKPQSRREYWLPKLQQNVERDARNESALRKAGWQILTVWECEVESPETLKRTLLAFLGLAN